MNKSKVGLQKTNDNVLILNLTESKLLAILIPGFWWFYWLLNSIDKFIIDPIFLWAGRDRLTQFANYFATIGITDENIALIFLIIVTAMEIFAFSLITLSLYFIIVGNYEKSRKFFFFGILTGLAIFTFFTIGDQIFGDRFELMEHTIYWSITLFSWFFYNHFTKSEN